MSCHFKSLSEKRLNKVSNVGTVCCVGRRSQARGRDSRTQIRAWLDQTAAHILRGEMESACRTLGAIGRLELRRMPHSVRQIHRQLTVAVVGYFEIRKQQ